MSRTVQLRLVKTLVILALTFGVLGVPSAEAHWAAPCYYYAGCEYCACVEYACVNGQEIPECAGNASCCSAALSNCWRYCIWY